MKLTVENLDKANRVIQSCRTMNQLKHAEIYCNLFLSMLEFDILNHKQVNDYFSIGKAFRKDIDKKRKEVMK